MYGDFIAVQCIKLIKFRWTGLVVQMETDDTARKVFISHPQVQ